MLEPCRKFGDIRDNWPYYYTFQMENNKGADQTVRMRGWSAPLLFTINKVRVSLVETHMLSKLEEFLEKEGLRAGLPSEAIDKVAKERKAEVTHFVMPYITQFTGMELVQKNECFFMFFEDWKLEIQCLIQSGVVSNLISWNNPFPFTMSTLTLI